MRMSFCSLSESDDDKLFAGPFGRTLPSQTIKGPLELKLNFDICLGLANRMIHCVLQF